VGESTPHLRPGLAGVDGAIQRGLRSAVNDAEVAALALMRSGEENVGIARVHDHVGAAGVVADFNQTPGPRLAAVDRLVETALTAALPQRAGRGDVDDVGIARIDHDARDVLGELESGVAERAPAILALVDSIAV